MTPEFKAWPKIPRLHRDITITEKIDGTNACVIVSKVDRSDGSGGFEVHAQSRKRIITPADDNFGFAAWVHDHADELSDLGEGYHYGEWYGRGIQRGYDLDERRFALFNTDRWGDERPACCDVVPALARTTADRLNDAVIGCVASLQGSGSWIAPGFDRPEGIVVYHHAANQSFKVLIEGDDQPKGVAA